MNEIAFRNCIVTVLKTQSGAMFFVMQLEKSIVLFGVKSPLVVDYEETLARLNVGVAAAISMGGAVRLLSRANLVLLEAAQGKYDGLPFIPCAFAPRNRRQLHDCAVDLGLSLHPGLIDPSATLSASSKMGAGCYVNAGAVFGGASRIGQCCVINRNASVGHHCIISDFASIGPGVTLASNVIMGPNAVVGAGATILPGVRIGEGAVVSGGAVVRRDVAPGTLVSGNPARASRLDPQKTTVQSNDQE